MADQTDLVIAVDTSQVKTATEALKALGYQAAAVTTASGALSKAISEAGRTGAAGMKGLSDEVKKTSLEAEKLSRTNFGNQVIRVDTSQVKRALDELHTLGFASAKAVSLNVGSTSAPQVSPVSSGLSNTVTAADKASVSTDKLSASLSKLAIQADEANRATTRTSKRSKSEPESIGQSVQDASHLERRVQNRDLNSSIKPASTPSVVENLKKSISSVGQESTDLDKVAGSLSNIAAEASRATSATNQLADAVQKPARIRDAKGRFVKSTIDEAAAKVEVATDYSFLREPPKSESQKPVAALFRAPVQPKSTIDEAVARVEAPTDYSFLREPSKQPTPAQQRQVAALFKAPVQQVEQLSSALKDVNDSNSGLESTSLRLADIGTKASESAARVAALRNQIEGDGLNTQFLAHRDANLTANRYGNGGGGRTPPPTPPGGGSGGDEPPDDPKKPKKTDLEEINSFMTATERADAAAAKMARSIASSSKTASQSLTDLSKATTSLGATDFISVDKLTTSLGATAVKAEEAAAAVNHLKINTSDLDKAGTSFGAKTGPIAPSSSSAIAATQTATATAINQATRAFDTQEGAVKKNTHAFEQHMKSTRRAAYETQQLEYQIHDFVVQVLGGQSPFLALVQQGSQLAGTFGGVGGAIRAVTALFTPFTIAIAAAAVSAGAFALAMAKIEQKDRFLNQIQIQFEAIGQAGALSNDQISKLVDTLAKIPGVSRDAARGIIGEFSKAHDIPAQLAVDLAKLVPDFARATGQKVEDAAKQLSGIFNDPIEGSKNLEKALGLLTSAEVLALREMSNIGDKAGAQDIMLKALQRTISGMAEKDLTDLQVALKDLGNAWDTMMKAFEDSQGLRTAVSLVAKLVDGVTWLVQNADKVPPIAAFAVAGPIGVAAQAALAIGADKVKNPDRVATGKITDVDGNPTTMQTVQTPSVNGAARTFNKEADDQVKDALERGKGFRSLDSQIDENLKLRKALSAAQETAIHQYGRESEQAKELGANIKGVDEHIAQLRKRQQSANSQGEQVLDLALKNKINDAKDAFTLFKDGLTTQESLLSTAYSLGEKSLQKTFDERIQIIKAGIDAQVKMYDTDMAAIRERMSDPTLDPVRRERFADQLDDMQRERNIVVAKGANELTQAYDKQRLAIEQLKDESANFRAELLRLQGDEAGAAKVLTESTIRRARITAGQINGTPGIKQVDLSAMERAINQQTTVDNAKTTIQNATSGLGITESTINRLINNGSISPISGINAQSAARQKTADELEKIVKGMEEVAALAENKDNWKLQLDTAQAREQLEALKDTIDPLKDVFDHAFRDGSSAALQDILNFTKTGKEALNDFGKHILATMNKFIADEISQKIFGKGGIFGEAGALMSKLFSDNKGTKADPTSADMQSLRASIDPTFASMTRLTTAADAAAAALGKISGVAPISGISGIGALSADVVKANAMPGDSLDNFINNKSGFGTIPSGEQSVMDQFKVSADSSKNLADVSNQAAVNIIAMSASAIKGGNALAALPAVLNSITASISASTATSSTTSGGGFLGGIISLFTKNYGSVDTMGSAAAVGSSMNFWGGGYTGDGGKYDEAGTVHKGEFVTTKEIVAQPGAREFLQDFNKRGMAAILEIKPKTKGYAEGGYVGSDILTGGNPSILYPSTKTSETAQPGGWTTSGDTHLHISVTPPPNTSRDSAMQWGAAAGRQIQHAVRRNS